MSTPDHLDEVLYKRLFDYRSAVANAALRFEDQASEKVRTTLYRADGRLRYWVFVYIVAIDLFSPDPLDFERPSSCQAEILRHCVRCEQPELLDLFPKARQSAWRAIVLMAERELTGKARPEDVPLEVKHRELEIGLIALGLEIDNSWNIAVNHLLDSIRYGRKDFAGRLMKRIDKQSKRLHFLRCAILSLWVHPDFPLWLMQAEPARQVVGMLGECWGVGGCVELKAYEGSRGRIVDACQLATCDKAVIRSVKIQSDSAVPIIESFGFTEKFSRCIPKLKPKQLYGGIRRPSPPKE